MYINNTVLQNRNIMDNNMSMKNVLDMNKMNNKP